VFIVESFLKCASESSFSKRGGYMQFNKLFFSFATLLFLSACTQEVQNKVGRAVQNWTGTDGVLDVYAGEVLVKRFIKIDKLSTAIGTSDSEVRSYRYGYGYLDANQNLRVDDGEKKVYFEFSDYSTSYIFYENPETDMANNQTH
jgi:hypothetical protein